MSEVKDQMMPGGGTFDTTIGIVRSTVQPPEAF